MTRFLRLKPSLALSIVVLFFFQAGCLKTRAQLKNDGYVKEDYTRSSSSQAVNRPTPVDPPGQSYAIDEIKTEITRINGKIDDLERSMNSAKAQTEKEGGPPNARALLFEQKLAELEQTQKLILDQLQNIQRSLPEPDPEFSFKKGKELLRAGKHKNAIDRFNEYLKKKKGKNRAEAVFMRAEALYQLKNYKKAINDYARFIENEFPRSHFKPRALYKIGLSYQGLGWEDDAKVFFQELVEKYPSSKQAKLVKSKLNAKKKKKKKKSSQ